MKFSIITILAVTVVFSPVLTATAQTLNGVGATFPAPLYEKYGREINKKYPELKVNYQAIGTAGGIRQIIAETIDFAGSDAAMKDDQIAKVKRGIILVPTAGSAVSVIYNLPGVNNLKLSRKTLPAIFSGQITNWNDPKIQVDNPDIKLPDLPIKIVIPYSDSGATFVLTNYLSAISPEFKEKIGTRANNWNLPNIINNKGCGGVAAMVARRPGLISYVSYSYAASNKIKSAQIQNKRGEFVSPSLQTANLALSTTEFPKDFRAFVQDPNKGYPLVRFTWMIIYQQYSDPTKADAIKKWVNWVLTDGQKFNNDLNYTTIPADVANRILKTVNSTVK